ncbi:MAG: GNAT family N-acetyltransferase [Desulfobacterales bacterium]|nr:GNAT family N-acetyltransferase [Desulfobacterales bacterium]
MAQPHKVPGEAVDPLAWEPIVASAGDAARAACQLGAGFSPARRAALQDKLERYARKPRRVLILAVCGSRVLGFVTAIEAQAAPASLSQSAILHLKDLAAMTGLLVDPRCRGRGIGEGLLRRAEQWCRERGKPGAWLVTHRMADWHRRHLGYREVGRILHRRAEKRVMARHFNDDAGRRPASDPPEWP